MTDDVVAGAVSIPHGLVDQNVSVLTSSGVGTTDALTGMVVQSGIPITLRPAAVRRVEVRRPKTPS